MHILLIPGWNEKDTDWQPVATQLETLGHTTTILDYVPPKNTDLEDQVELAQQFINQKTLVVGYSVGGLIAVQLLHQKMHHVVGGVLFSTPSLKHVGWRRRVVKLFNFFTAPIRILIPGFIKRWFAKLSRQLIRVNANKRTYLSVISDEQDTLLPLIPVPVKLVWGEHDKLVSPKIGEAMQETLPNADFVTVTKYGACIHKNNPKLAAEIIAGFADENN